MLSCTIGQLTKNSNVYFMIDHSMKLALFFQYVNQRLWKCLNKCHSQNLPSCSVTYNLVLNWAMSPIKILQYTSWWITQLGSVSIILLSTNQRLWKLWKMDTYKNYMTTLYHPVLNWDMSPKKKHSQKLLTLPYFNSTILPLLTDQYTLDHNGHVHSHPLTFMSQQTEWEH